MKEDANADSFFTTMFDLYALPDDFPGYRRAQRVRDPYKKVALLEDAFEKDVDHRRFLPYLQLHEFEALVLADPRQLDWVFIEHHDAIERLVRLCESYESPELIDDGVETAASKRVIQEIPEYADAKATSGPMVVEKIGVEVLRVRCPHFGAWLARLEALPG